RARLAEEIRLPYMTTALMKGCSPLKARWRHAFPNALLPLVAVFGSRIGGVIGGAVIIETLFALPGLGRLAVTSALGRDHPVIIGIVLFAFLAMALANLLADLVALWLNPRLRDQPA
ncbi:MAG: ABC transporter permease, partial [Sphingopyxis sp.]|nr:ABC transporter permease [Sphingopyxis sp.]